MRVHIERWHGGNGIPIDNHEEMRSANPSIIKDNPLKFHYNRALRRFLPISAPHNGGSNYISAYPASDPFHNSVLIWEKMLNLTERSNSLIHYSPYPSSDPSSFHYPPATQYVGLFQSPSTMQNNCLQDNNPATVNNCPHTTIEQAFCEDVIGFRMDVCPRCLDLYSITIYEQSEVPLRILSQR
jgi:hypothetical protein